MTVEFSAGGSPIVVAYRAAAAAAAQFAEEAEAQHIARVRIDDHVPSDLADMPCICLWMGP
ncbi:hypothetical protein [Nocardia sp. BMG51109]|uniref:hypothetical protein n=1 Tax=Nocardia sp. BMG51109 TaxID=1056816 RepID=UPI000465A9FB|nr:hypothetical protein [Nocardia sp. BMG51109]